MPKEIAAGNVGLMLTLASYNYQPKYPPLFLTPKQHILTILTTATVTPQNLSGVISNSHMYNLSGAGV